MAKNVNGKLLQGTDEIVYSLFNNALWAYVYGEKTKEQALADFRTQSVAALSNEVLKRLGLILNDSPSESPPVVAPNNASKLYFLLYHQILWDVLELGLFFLLQVGYIDHACFHV